MQKLLKNIMPLSAALCLFGSCSDRSAESIPVIDLASNLMAVTDSEIPFPFAATAMFHPAVTDTTLLNYPEFCGIDGKRLYLLHHSMSDARLMVFDMESRACLSSFDHTGNGPEEYNDVWSAGKTPGSDGWTVYDLNAHKVLYYSLTGNYAGQTEFSASNGITPLGEGWIGENRRENGVRKVFYRFTPSLEIVDSIVTDSRWHITKEGVSSATRLQAAPDLVYWHENDTLFTIPARGNIAPVAEFELGSYRMPKFDSYETERQERDKYLTYFVFATDKALLVYYMRDEKFAGQVYDRADGSLRYAVTGEEFGFPITIDGAIYHGMPWAIDADGSVLFLVTADEMAAITGDEEANPAIIRASITL